MEAIDKILSERIEEVARITGIRQSATKLRESCTNWFNAMFIPLRYRLEDDSIIEMPVASGGDYMRCGGYDMTHNIYVELPTSFPITEAYNYASICRIRFGFSVKASKVIPAYPSDSEDKESKEVVGPKITDLPEVWEETKKFLQEHVQPMIAAERKVHKQRLEWVKLHPDDIRPEWLKAHAGRPNLVEAKFMALFGTAVRNLRASEPSDVSDGRCHQIVKWEEKDGYSTKWIPYQDLKYTLETEDDDEWWKPVLAERLQVWESVVGFKYPNLFDEIDLDQGFDSEWSFPISYNLGDYMFTIPKVSQYSGNKLAMGGYDFLHNIYVETPPSSYQKLGSGLRGSWCSSGLRLDHGKLIDQPEVWKRTEEDLTKKLLPIVTEERKIHTLRLEWVRTHRDALGPNSRFTELFGWAANEIRSSDQATIPSAKCYVITSITDTSLKTEPLPFQYNDKYNHPTKFTLTEETLLIQRLNEWACITGIRYPFIRIEELIRAVKGASFPFAFNLNKGICEAFTLTETGITHFCNKRGGYDAEHKIWISPPPDVELDTPDRSHDLEFGLRWTEGRLIEQPDVWEKTKQMMQSEKIQTVMRKERAAHAYRLQWVKENTDILDGDTSFEALYGMAAREIHTACHPSDDKDYVWFLRKSASPTLGTCPYQRTDVPIEAYKKMRAHGIDCSFVVDAMKFMI